MLRVLCVLAAGLALSGCATVARGTSEQVAFDTVPSGAEVRVVIEQSYKPPEGEPALPPATMGCVTPCVLQVKRLDKMAVTVTKPGYENEAFSLVPQPSAEGVGTSVAGNILLLGGVTGLIVDGVSGAGLDKCPNPVRIALRPLAPPGFGFDPVAACEAQKAAKTRSAEQTPLPGAM